MARSSTWTTLSVVSTNAGIFPLRKSSTSFPVGVGLTSPGPIGKVGSTRETGAPCAAAREDLVLGDVLRSLVETEQVGDVRVAGLVRRFASRCAVQSQHSDSARVDNSLASTSAGRFDDVQHPTDVDLVEVLRLWCPESVHRREVKDEPCAVASLDEGFAVPYVDFDEFDPEAVQDSECRLPVRPAPPRAPCGQAMPGRRRRR